MLWEFECSWRWKQLNHAGNLKKKCWRIRPGDPTWIGCMTVVAWPKSFSCAAGRGPGRQDVQQTASFFQASCADPARQHFSGRACVSACGHFQPGGRCCRDWSGRGTMLDSRALAGILCFIAASFRARKISRPEKQTSTGSDCHFFRQACPKHFSARTAGFCQHRRKRHQSGQTVKKSFDSRKLTLFKSLAFAGIFKNFWSRSFSGCEKNLRPRYLALARIMR